MIIWNLQKNILILRKLLHKLKRVCKKKNQKQTVTFG
jgi:hypothetical protein